MFGEAQRATATIVACLAILRPGLVPPGGPGKPKTESDAGVGLRAASGCCKITSNRLTKEKR